MSSECPKTMVSEPLNKFNLAASLAFFFGSTMFLPQFSQFATTGVYLFMLGSALMFIDATRARLLRLFRKTDK